MLQLEVLELSDTFLQHSFLAHHGILGMKWGIRRYQNKDGSLTSEGRIHYGSKTRDVVKPRIGKPEYGTPEYDSFIKKNAEVLNKGLKKMSDIKMYNDMSAMKDPKTKREWRDAADLGLKVYENNGELDLQNISDKERNSLRNWFIYEDQTIGKPEIAAMVNRGYKNEEIKNLLNIARDSGSVYDDVDINNEFGKAFRFGASEGYNLEDFVDGCFNVKKKQKS